MPIVLVLLFVFLLLALWVVLLPLSLWQRYRYGRAVSSRTPSWFEESP